MAVVWRAIDTVLGREVAIKLLNTDAEIDTAVAGRLKAEAQAIARLKHRHVLGIYDFGYDVADDGAQRPFVVMELVAGDTLQDLMTDGTPMPWRQATTIVSQVASALAYAHERGIVHRDISCANISLTEDGVKVLDFGIAALLGQPDSGDGEVLLGTPAYIAPERLRAQQAPVAPAADIYALGVVWYRMMAGAMPWNARTATGLIQAHLVYAPAPLPEVEGLPPRLRELCMACLAKNPLDRPTSRDLADELARFPLEPADPLTNVSSATGEKNTRHKRVLVVTAAAAVIGTALAGAVWPGWSGKPQTAVPQAIATAPQSVQPSPSLTTATTEPSGSASRAPVVRAPANGPAQAAPSPPEAAPEPEPEGLFRALGGLVQVICVGTKAQVINVTTLPGYIIKELKAGPADEVRVVLKSATNESDVKVRCTGGVLTPTIEEDQKAPPPTP